MGDEIRLLNLKELSAALKISRWTLRRWIESGKIPKPIHLQGNYWSRESVDEIVKQVNSKAATKA